jgi:2-methylcitrate dehydratase PrpD
VISARDPSQTFARFAAELTFERLPSALLPTLKCMVADTLGCALAGTTLGSGCPELIELVARAGGAPESTLLGIGGRVPAPAAALVNGATAHALNYDDIFPAGGGHLTAVTLPAALAVAERQGSVCGRELLVALAAGAEVMARLQHAVHVVDDGSDEAKPQPTQLLGAFAAATSAARVLRLDAAGTWSALGLALMQASGSRQPVLEGTASKALYAAFPSQAGVLSALLAAGGVDGRCDALEGEAGLFPSLYRSRFDRDLLLRRLGDEYLIEQVGFKPWPTTNHAHVFIEAALTLAAGSRFDWRRLQRVVVIGGPHIRAFCEPLDIRRHPTRWVQAEDSIPFTVATALVQRRLSLADFAPDELARPEVAQVADRLEYRVDPGVGQSGTVEATFSDGEVISARIDQPLGYPARPLSGDALRAKFVDCAGHAVPSIAAAQIERVLETLRQLEQVDDVRTLADLLCVASAPVPSHGQV